MTRRQTPSLSTRLFGWSEAGRTSQGVAHRNDPSIDLSAWVAVAADGRAGGPAVSHRTDTADQAEAPGSHRRRTGGTLVRAEPRAPEAG